MTSRSPAEPNLPVGVDPDRANIARVYDYALGGKDNYEIDRSTLAKIQETTPSAIDLAVDNRKYLTRVARFLSTQTPCEQFLDLGSGLPTAENTHQIVQRFNRDARVVYVDHDPVVLAHGRALLEDQEHSWLVDGDIFTPSSVLDDEVVSERIDFDKPVALIAIAALHHLKGERQKQRQNEVMAEYIDRLPSGSYVALSHLLEPENEYDEAQRALADSVQDSSLGGLIFRTRDEIKELLPGMELVDPGVVECYRWWPDGPQLRPVTTPQNLIGAVVARKP
jgi:hypothetical protein